MDIDVKAVGSKVREDKDFFVSRLSGHPRYVFIQFLTEVQLVIDNKDYILSPGTCIIYTPQFPQYYKPTTGALNHDWIEFKCDDENIFTALMLPLNHPFTTTISKVISNQVSAICDSYKSNLFYKEIDLTAKMYELFISISKNIHHKYQNLNQSYKQDICNKFEEIRLNIFQNPIKASIKKIANNAGYTQSYFCAIYKKLFNVTPLQDLDKSRMQYVKSVIGTKKSSTIVDELGFSSQEYFYMWFKKNFGMTIAEYQAMHKKTF